MEARERGCMNKSVEKSFNSGNGSTGRALLTGSQGELNCLFCNGNHRASECQAGTNLDGIREILKKQGIVIIAGVVEGT